MNMGVKADTHLHVEEDFWKCRFVQEHGYNSPNNHKFVPVSILQEELKKRELNGAVILCHSNYKYYKEDYDEISEFYKNEKNLIPGVEISTELRTNYEYYGKVHVTYLGRIPEEDFDYGSWFCHSTTTKGIFKKFYHLYNKNFKKKAVKRVLKDDELMKKYNVRIVETTRRTLDDVLLLNDMNLTVLLGTDAHPDEKNKYGKILGKQGIILNSDTFNYKSFMHSLKNNEISYFNKKEGIILK